MSEGCYLFVSTHLDDAVLSCGGYIHRFAGAGERVVIATVVTADLPPGGGLSWLAQRGHRAWNLGEFPFAIRCLEDEAATSILGASYLHLGFLDAIYRRDDAGLPLYPKNSVGVAIHPHDAEYFEPAVREKLSGIRPTYGDSIRVFCPLGAGGHVDHLIVRRVVESLWEAPAITYYEDFPYSGYQGAIDEGLALDSRASWSSITVELSEIEIVARSEAVARYVSQIPGLFPSRCERLIEIVRARLPFLSELITPPSRPSESYCRMATFLRAYIAAVGGERYWRLCGDSCEVPARAR